MRDLEEVVTAPSPPHHPCPMTQRKGPVRERRPPLSYIVFGAIECRCSGTSSRTSGGAIRSAASDREFARTLVAAARRQFDWPRPGISAHPIRLVVERAEPPLGPHVPVVPGW